MGSRATVILAITKEAYVASVLKEDLPRLLKDPPKDHEGAMYWRFESVFWDRRVKEVDEVLDYLNGLDEANEDFTTNPSYGCVELWDEGMNDTMGDPDHFDIYVIQRIASPFDDKKET